MADNPFEFDLGGGEIEYRPAPWKEKVDSYRVRPDVLDFTEIDRQQRRIQRKEVAMKHPLTDAIFKMNDDGTVDLFGNGSVGIRLDPNTNSLYLYGDNVNVFSKSTNIRTNPLGLQWNNKYVNPDSPSFLSKDSLEHYSPQAKKLMQDYNLTQRGDSK